MGMKMNANNRWVKKAERIPWDKIEEKYAELFPSKTGMPARPLRMALGSLLIQKQYDYSDKDIAELRNRNKPRKHEELAAKMMEILQEDECNDTYGRERMHKALLLKYPDFEIPSETTVYRVMTAIGITHRPNRKPNGITKADREARKSDDLLKRDFKADKPFSKCVTDITEVKAILTISFIAEIEDGTLIGYKYFKFDGVDSI